MEISNNSQSNSKIQIRPPKINGFTQKKNIQQILSYIIVTLLFFVFTFCILPALSLAVQIISGILYYGTFIAMFILGYICTEFDPTDQLVTDEKIARMNKQDYDTSHIEFYCINCTTHVSNNSKHCKACNRCVADFDHHCKWLNNCVGQANYSRFMKLIIVVLVNSVIFSIFGCIALFIYYFKSDYYDELKDDLFFLFSDDSSLTIYIFKIFIWTFIVIGFLISFFDGNLVLFHFYLQKNKLTTYQYIMNKREKQTIKEQKQKEMQEKRQKEKEDKQKQIAYKKKEQQILRKNSQTNSIFGGNTNQKTKQLNTQTSQINSQQNNNSINFQNQGQNVNNYDEKNVPLESRQDSLDTHSQKTNHFEFSESKKVNDIKNKTQFSQKKPQKKGIFDKICCCFKSKQNQIKVGIVGLTQIDEQSEIVDERDENNRNFAVIDINSLLQIQEMNQRGICQTIDIMDEIHKTNPLNHNNKQIDIEMIQQQNYLNKATKTLYNQHQDPISQYRVETEQQNLKDHPQEIFSQKTINDINPTHRQVNQNPLIHKKSGLDIFSVNLTQKTNQSPEKQSLKDDLSKSGGSQVDGVRHKKQHFPPEMVYQMSSSTTSSKNNNLREGQQSSQCEAEVKTEDKHNTIPPSQIVLQQQVVRIESKIRINSDSLNDALE